MATRQMDLYGNGELTSQSAKSIRQVSCAVSGTAPGQLLLVQWDDTKKASEILAALHAVREDICAFGLIRPGSATVISLP